MGVRRNPQPTQSKAVRTRISPETRVSVVAMLTVHFRSIREVARHHRLEERVVQEILYEALTRRVDESYRRGYVAGRMSILASGAAERAA